MPSIVRSAMFLALVAIATLHGDAAARVGVTSATDGDPLGRPPAAAERILRVGIDIEANERVTTRAEDRAHVVFLDGTSITLGPNSALTVDKFVFDAKSGKGDMGVTLTKGVFRLVGGKISKKSEITIATLSATVGIRGGIVAVTVAEDGKTKADFLYGERMRVTAQGVTQVAQRPGSRIEAEMRRPPSVPMVLPPGGASTLTKALEKPAAASTVPKTSAPIAVSTSVNRTLADTKLLVGKPPQERKNPTVAAAPVHKPSALQFQAPAKKAVQYHPPVVVTPSKVPAAPRR